MNKIILFTLGLAALFFLSACGDEATSPATGDRDHSEKEHKEHKGSDAKAAFACPMKCEEEKTYPEAGKCPKCEMDLKAVAAKKEHKHDDGHDHAH